MYDVITFGSASEDIYLKSSRFLPLNNKNFETGRGLCVDAGSKIQLDDILIASGGGGTNTAVTFVRQGLKVAYCGMVGSDHFGGSIIRELTEAKIDTSLIKRSREKKTNVSIVLSHPSEDKTNLIYRSASGDLKKKDIPWQHIKKTKWFYIASLSGSLCGLTEYLVDFARKNNIKIACNPGYEQFNLPRFKQIINKVDVLILNQREASLLTQIPYAKEESIFLKMSSMVSGILVMTKGKRGVVVHDKHYFYKAKALEAKLVDSTGAGDSFGAGFVTELIKRESIVLGIQLGMANATSNIKEFGAKAGLLKKGQGFQKAKVEIRSKY